MGNSLVIAASTVVLTVSRHRRWPLFVSVHVKFGARLPRQLPARSGLMFPAATAILPLFIKIRDLGLLDTYAA